MLDICEQGDWQHLVAFTPEFLSLMAKFHSTTHSNEIAIRNREQLQAIIQMLETATRRCSARQEEIRSLVDALKISPATTETP